MDKISLVALAYASSKCREMSPEDFYDAYLSYCEEFQQIIPKRDEEMKHAPVLKPALPE